MRNIDLIISRHELRRIGVAACVDPRTVARFLRGERLTSTCRARIEQALVELKIEVARPQTSNH